MDSVKDYIFKMLHIQINLKSDDLISLISLSFAMILILCHPNFLESRQPIIYAILF